MGAREVTARQSRTDRRVMTFEMEHLRVDGMSTGRCDLRLLEHSEETGRRRLEDTIVGKGGALGHRQHGADDLGARVHDLVAPTKVTQTCLCLGGLHGKCRMCRFLFSRTLTG